VRMAGGEAHGGVGWLGRPATVSFLWSLSVQVAGGSGYGVEEDALTEMMPMAEQGSAINAPRGVLLLLFPDGERGVSEHGTGGIHDFHFPLTGHRGVDLLGAPGSPGASLDRKRYFSDHLPTV
jgi:hypothetical protein